MILLAKAFGYLVAVAVAFWLFLIVAAAMIAYHQFALLLVCAVVVGAAANELSE